MVQNPCYTEEHTDIQSYQKSGDSIVTSNAEREHEESASPSEDTQVIRPYSRRSQFYDLTIVENTFQGLH